MTFVLPSRDDMVLVETDLMRQITRRTLTAHPRGGFVVWSGPSRNGKSVTARWLVEGLNAMSESDPLAFKAVHFEVAKSTRCNQPRDEARRAVQRVWLATIGKMMEGRYRAPAEELARELTHALQARRLELILVDEAGGLSLDELRGLMTLINVAANEHHRLTIVLIGMDELPNMVERLDQIRERVVEVCYFAPYSAEDCMVFLKAMLPYFAAAKASDLVAKAEADFIIGLSEGLPGRLAAYCTRVRGMLIDRGEEITMENLRMVNMLKEVDMKRAKAMSQPRRPTLSAVTANHLPPERAKGLMKKKPLSVSTKTKASERRASSK